MHLATLALLQVIEIPKGAVIVNKTHTPYEEFFWQCQSHPIKYSLSEIEKKCPRLVPEVNMCCALRNDCLSTGNKVEDCNRKNYECNQLILSTAHRDDLENCYQLPIEIKNHLDSLPSEIAFTSSSTSSYYLRTEPLLKQVYHSCPYKTRTASTCFYNFETGKYFSSSVNSTLEKLNRLMVRYDLRVCMEMMVDENDGNHCLRTVKGLLTAYDSEEKYENVIKNIEEESKWKCGSNHYDTYVTQVLIGTGCFWLKEAYNTCCKFHDQCYFEHKNKTRCDIEWNNCNRAVITNTDGSIVKECLPFTTWISRFQKQNIPSSLSSHSKKEEDVKNISASIWVSMSVILNVIFLIAFFFSFLCWCLKNKKHQKDEEKLIIEEKSVEHV